MRLLEHEVTRHNEDRAMVMFAHFQHYDGRISWPAKSFPIAQGLRWIRPAQTGLLQIDIDLRITRQWQIFDGLAFAEHTFAVG